MGTTFSINNDLAAERGDDVAVRKVVGSCPGARLDDPQAVAGIRCTAAGHARVGGAGLIREQYDRPDWRVLVVPSGLVTVCTPLSVVILLVAVLVTLIVALKRFATASGVQPCAGAVLEVGLQATVPPGRFIAPTDIGAVRPLIPLPPIFWASTLPGSSVHSSPNIAQLRITAAPRE